jgi:xanthine dehydrogenase YagS FAD-binding subunit
MLFRKRKKRVIAMLYEMPVIEYAEVTTTDQAVALLKKHSNHAAVLAGATDLLGMLKDKIEGPELKIPEILINIKSIKNIDQITTDRDIIRIGAAVTLTSLIHSDIIQKIFPSLSQAALLVGNTQIRNMGTIGGNLCQRPRCMYFRHPDFICSKKGGKTCFAVTGEHKDYHAILNLGKCVMAHPSDTATILVALNAKGVIAGSEGETTVPIQDFFTGPNSYRDTVLAPDQFLKEIQLHYPKTGTRQIFLKQRVRHSTDFALASVAAAVVIKDGICSDINLVMGGVSIRPLVVKKAVDILQDKQLDNNIIDQAAEAAVEGARPLKRNHYKTELTKALVKRALTIISQEV